MHSWRSLIFFEVSDSQLLLAYSLSSTSCRASPHHQHVETSNGCVPQNSDPKKSILRTAGQVRVNASAGDTVTFSGRTWYEIRIRETKGPLEELSKKATLMNEIILALKFEARTPEETSRQQDCARKAPWDLAKSVCKLKADDRATFYSLAKIKAPVLVSKNAAYVCLWLIREFQCTC